MISQLGLPAHPRSGSSSPARTKPKSGNACPAAEPLLDAAASNHLIGKYLLPDTLWPREENQAANREPAKFLGGKGPLLLDTALKSGFNTNAMMLTEELRADLGAGRRQHRRDVAHQPPQRMGAETIRLAPRR